MIQLTMLQKEQGAHTVFASNSTLGSSFMKQQKVIIENNQPMFKTSTHRLNAINIEIDIE